MNRHQTSICSQAKNYEYHLWDVQLAIRDIQMEQFVIKFDHPPNYRWYFPVAVIEPIATDVQILQLIIFHKSLHHEFRRSEILQAIANIEVSYLTRGWIDHLSNDLCSLVGQMVAWDVQ